MLRGISGCGLDHVRADPGAAWHREEVASSHVWYVSYGSNMAAERLSCYVLGGCPPGGTRVNPGARDPSPPARSLPVDLPGTVYFAGESPQWGGGVAFYDHETPGRAVGRGYLVSSGQFADIVAQEVYRVPQEGDPLEAVVTSPLRSGGHTLGPGRYETLLEVGRYDGLPLLTFTCPHGAGHVPHSRPTEAYLDMMRTGLRESRGWDVETIEEYLDHISRRRRGGVTPYDQPSPR